MSMAEIITVRPLAPVAFDLYRDIHKGIRAELFAAVGDAGRLDPNDHCGVTALADQVRATVNLLVDHARHEDGAIQPALERHAPELAARVEDEHRALESRMEHLLALSAPSVAAGRAGLHELYVELAAFTGAYLLHQDLEEREIGRALESALGVEGVLGLHQAIITNMAPQELTSGLAVMFPAMNVDDRTELLGGMRATAPAPAFDAVWSLAKSVLGAAEHRAVADRLGLH